MKSSHTPLSPSRRIGWFVPFQVFRRYVRAYLRRRDADRARRGWERTCEMPLITRIFCFASLRLCVKSEPLLTRELLARRHRSPDSSSVLLLLSCRAFPVYRNATT